MFCSSATRSPVQPHSYFHLLSSSLLINLLRYSVAYVQPFPTDSKSVGYPEIIELVLFGSTELQLCFKYWPTSPPPPFFFLPQYPFLTLLNTLIKIIYALSKYIAFIMPAKEISIYYSTFQHLHLINNTQIGDKDWCVHNITKTWFTHSAIASVISVRASCFSNCLIFIPCSLEN